MTLHPDQAVLLAVIEPVARSACTNDSLLKWNVMQLIRRGSNFFFFAAYCGLFRLEVDK